MKMKIVQLVGQSERSVSAENVFSPNGDVSVVEAATLDAFSAALGDDDVDLALCSTSEFLEQTLLHLRDHAPHLPVILTCSDSERAVLLQDKGLEAWDIISFSTWNVSRFQPRVPCSRIASANGSMMS